MNTELQQAAHKIKCAVAWLESDVASGILPAERIAPLVQWLKEAQATIENESDTIAALNKRIDFLNAKWNEYEPLYSIAPTA